MPNSLAQFVRTPTNATPAKLAALRRALTGWEARDTSRYRQLRAAIVATIQAGHWRPGERLPTETALAAALPFSLGTIQRALRALVEEGVVRRVQGSGTFVASDQHRIDDVAHCRFLADDGLSILPVFSRVLARRQVRSKGPWSEHFTDVGARLVQLDRALNVNDEFEVFNRFYFDGERFEGLALRPLTELAGANFKALLRREVDFPVTSVSEWLTLAVMPAEVAQRIGMRPGATGGILEIVARSVDDITVYYQQMYIPPSPRKLIAQPAN
ncbi:MAG: GntR family transcriptional regulator [Casimicrobiaceae bacterium]